MRQKDLTMYDLIFYHTLKNSNKIQNIFEGKKLNSIMENVTFIFMNSVF